MAHRICTTHLYTVIPITLLSKFKSYFFLWISVNFFKITKTVINFLEDKCHLFQSVLFMLIVEKWTNERTNKQMNERMNEWMNEWKRIQNYFQGSKKIQKGSIQVTIPFISCSVLITDRREKCGTYSRFPPWLCCFSAKRKISNILCKILNVMSQIFFRGAEGKTAKIKCFSIAVMILISFPKHFGIHS